MPGPPPAAVGGCLTIRSPLQWQASSTRWMAEQMPACSYQAKLMHPDGTAGQRMPDRCLPSQQGTVPGPLASLAVKRRCTRLVSM
jgi:hypothetical protein